MNGPASPNPKPLSLLSIVLPARDEEGCIASTVEHLHVELRLQNIPHEIVVVDDGSSDQTWKILTELQLRIPNLAPTQNPGPHGFGRAIIWGLNQMQGDAVVIMMADESDDVRDVVRYWRLLDEGYDCVFGSRFMRGGGVIDYPRFKLFLNRIANKFLQVLFRIAVGFGQGGKRLLHRVLERNGACGGILIDGGLDGVGGGHGGAPGVE